MRGCGRGLTVLCLLLVLLTARVFAAEDWHEAYLEGYPDGTIRPEAALSREELAQILYRLLPEQERETADYCWFSDVQPDRWSYPAVSKAVKLGLLYGDTEGCFHPEASVTGPELALVLNRIANTLKGSETLPMLADAWSGREISFRRGFGWVMGLQNGQFDADAPLTRAQTAHILNELLNRQPESLDSLMIGMPIFHDNADIGAWYFLDLQEAAVGHTFLSETWGEIWTGLG